MDDADFSPDGQRLATCSADRTVRIWNVETGALQQRLKGHTGSVYSVAFSHDSRRLAAGSSDQTIRILDAETPGTSVLQPGDVHVAAALNHEVAEAALSKKTDGAVSQGAMTSAAGSDWQGG